MQHDTQGLKGALNQVPSEYTKSIITTLYQTYSNITFLKILKTQLRMLDRKIHQIRSQNVQKNNKIQQIILSLIWDKKKTVEISFFTNVRLRTS